MSGGHSRNLTHEIKMKLRITKTQAAAIEHRLGVDFLGSPDYHDGVFDFQSELGFTFAEAEASLYEILPKQIQARCLDKADWNPATPHVLAECIDGSTWVGVCETDAQYYGAVRTLRSLSEKFESVFNIRTEVPTY